MIFVIYIARVILSYRVCNVALFFNSLSKKCNSFF